MYSFLFLFFSLNLIYAVLDTGDPAFFFSLKVQLFL